MKYPDFFEAVESIKMKDPLSSVLGVFEDGNVEFTYLDVVKSAGHSCPTVAGAYIVTLEALKVLYPDERALRGDVKVEFKESVEDGVAGVIANVIAHITGATDKSGFKGLNGKFARHSLVHFNSSISASVRFTSIKNEKSVDVVYDPSSIEKSLKMMPLMQKILSEKADEEEKKEFGLLWQERVKNIFENIDSVVKLTQS